MKQSKKVYSKNYIIGEMKDSLSGNTFVYKCSHPSGQICLLSLRPEV
jgi:hypothetical protein